MDLAPSISPHSAEKREMSMLKCHGVRKPGAIYSNSVGGSLIFLQLILASLIFGIYHKLNDTDYEIVSQLGTSVRVVGITISQGQGKRKWMVPRLRKLSGLWWQPSVIGIPSVKIYFALYHSPLVSFKWYHVSLKWL